MAVLTVPKGWVPWKWGSSPWADLGSPQLMGNLSTGPVSVLSLMRPGDAPPRMAPYFPAVLQEGLWFRFPKMGALGWGTASRLKTSPVFGKLAKETVSHEGELLRLSLSALFFKNHCIY